MAAVTAAEILLRRSKRESKSSSGWCCKAFFEENLDFPKIKKLNKVCSDYWTCTKMLFSAKLGILWNC